MKPIDFKRKCLNELKQGIKRIISDDFFRYDYEIYISFLIQSLYIFRKYKKTIDSISESSKYNSFYFYTKKGIIRVSDHEYFFHKERPLLLDIRIKI